LTLLTPLSITVNNAIAWVAGVVFAFVINKLWVFESKSKQAKTVIKEFVSFVVSRALTGVLEIFAPEWLIKLGLNQTIFGIKGMLAKLLVSIIVVILNYVFSKLIVFKKKKH
jgi:putative flippase GtrA